MLLPFFKMNFPPYFLRSFFFSSLASSVCFLSIFSTFLLLPTHRSCKYVSMYRYSWWNDEVEKWIPHCFDNFGTCFFSSLLQKFQCFPILRKPSVCIFKKGIVTSFFHEFYGWIWNYLSIILKVTFQHTC